MFTSSLGFGVCIKLCGFSFRKWGSLRQHFQTILDKDIWHGVLGPKKEWDKLGVNAKKYKTNDGLEILRKTAIKLGTSFHQLLAYYGSREANIQNEDDDLKQFWSELNR